MSALYVAQRNGRLTAGDQAGVGDVRGFGGGGERAGPLIGDVVPWADAEGDEVGRQRVVDDRAVGGRPGVVVRAGRGVHGVVGDHRPVRRGVDGEIVGGLDVRLVEAGEDTLGVGGLELGVHVHLVVHRVLEAVQALAGGGVQGLGDDGQLVASCRKVGELQAVGLVVASLPIAGNGGGQDVLPVQRDAGDFLGAQVDEG